MTQSFDDFYEENKDVFDPCVWRSAEKAFQAGAQSKQAEIDELNKKLKSNERVFKKLKDQMVSHACESDELRRRINDAVKSLEHSKPLMICYSDALLALDILKGTTNEQ